MYYDTIYKNNRNFSGKRTNKLLVQIVKQLPINAHVLDLGCGQGRDAFYLARKKFNVTAVDNSKVAISQIKEEASQKHLKNIQAFCKNIEDFKIERKKFSVINIIGTLHFLKKTDALKFIDSAKRNILPHGFIIITSFTTNNPRSKRRKTHFKLGELKKIFSTSDFKIIHYLEYDFLDSGHEGQLEPHKHGMVAITAQKK